MIGPQVYNMPSGVPFLTSLAEGLRGFFPDDLQDALILLPTRRAVRGMGEAFVTAARGDGTQATLLPRMRPLADIDPEEPPFEPGELVGLVRPAIDATQRRFEMARVVAEYHKRVSDLPLDAAAALAMADPLLNILDDAALEEARLTQTEAWSVLMAEAAKHYQDAATLYRIIQDFWPARLSELEMEEPQTRKVKLLHLLCETWLENPPKTPIIIAGSTGSLQATRRLMKIVASLPKGLVVLPGFQKTDNDQTWAKIDPQHPQFGMKRIVEDLGLDRGNIPDWPSVTAQAKPLEARRRLLEDALTPVGRTHDWIGRIKKLRGDFGEDVFEKATKGLARIEARTDADEATTIALILRETLETPHATAALVTPDQKLARRVRARLARWDVSVDMSQGEPLAETPIGVFLDAVLALSQNPEGDVERAVMFQHQLTALNAERGAALAAWQPIERDILRTEQKIGAPARVPDEFETQLNNTLAPLIELDGLASAPVWASALIAASEQIATRSDRHGSEILWRGEAGQAAAALLEGIVIYGNYLPDVDTTGFLRLMRNLMRGKVVRKRYGSHPRLSILGPLEARMLSADVIILGGLNEGTWPAAPQPGPFLSRGMRREMGLSLPERRYGLAAHDFFELAANPTVFLTRSKRSESGPTVASRWLWRLQTLLQGAAKDGSKWLQPDQDYAAWAEALDHVMPKHVVKAEPPEPKPPVAKRWSTDKGRSLSITEVKTLIRDPYATYGKHVLRLRRLKDLGQSLGASEFGSAVHLGLENFLNEHPSPLREAQDALLVEALEDAFSLYGYPEEVIAKERGRFEVIAQALREELNRRHAAGYDIVGQEVWGEADVPGRNFTIRGKMDFVERGPDGYGFVDFKTGTPAGDAEVAAGFDPQLPLAAWILEQGGLTGHGKATTAQLGYLQVKGSNNSFKYKPIGQKKDIETLTAEAIETLDKLIARYDDPEIGYGSQVRTKYTNSWSDFEGLARRGEWAGILGEGTKT
jgi:ATP-dependent helicase/nuclease subunit B